MSAHFQQVTEGQWPNGLDKPIAILRAEPEEIERKYGVRFSSGRDDLDEFQEAALRLSSGRPVLLMRYLRSPGPGTTVSVDRLDSAKDAFHELRESLGLSRRGITWVTDELKEEQSSSLRTWLVDTAVTRIVAQLLTTLLGRARVP